MKKYGKIVIAALLFVIFLVGSSVLYNNLSDDYRPNTIGEIGGNQENSGEAELQEPESEEPESEAMPAPDFTVYDAEGNEVKLSDYFGEPIVLNFWASWCGPCKSEMPMFQEMYETYGDDMTFLMVNLTDGAQETEETAEKYIEKQGYTFPVYFDKEQDAAYAYYVSSIPVTYFIDAGGNLAAYGMGAMDEESFLTGVGMLQTNEE